MTNNKSKKEPMLTILFLLATFVIVFGDRFLSGLSYLITQIISYVFIIYLLYAEKIFSMKPRVLLIVGYSLMLIGEIGSYLSTH